MSESDERRDDERDEAAPVAEHPDWNTPEIETTTGGDGSEQLSVAARRVLASDQHLSQRRVFYGQAGADEDETEPTDEDEAPQ